MAKNSPRIKIMLNSTGKTQKGRDTGTAYYVYYNERNSDKKLELMKYDARAWNEETSRLGKKVLFKQKKIPK